MNMSMISKVEKESNRLDQVAREDQPQYKMLERGKKSLTDSELLALIIKTGTAKMTAHELAKRLLSSVDNKLDNLPKLSILDLMKFDGLGESKALAIVASLELGLRRNYQFGMERTKITSSDIVYELMKPNLQDLAHEEFWIILLNRANKVLKKIQISSGGVTGTVADPKIIFRHALENLACGLILVHNHPSGNKSPSQSDINLTRKLKSGAIHLEISILDHLIFTNDGFYSFGDEGII